MYTTILLNVGLAGTALIAKFVMAHTGHWQQLRCMFDVIIAVMLSSQSVKISSC